jgi:hypothetical protein
MSSPQPLVGSIVLDESQPAFVCSFKASRTVLVREVRGYVHSLEQFGASRPRDYGSRILGEGVTIPDVAQADLDTLRAAHFCWTCSVPIPAGGRYEVRIPFTVPSTEPIKFDFMYTYSRLLGLWKQNGMVRLVHRRGAQQADPGHRPASRASP